MTPSRIASRKFRRLNGFRAGGKRAEHYATLRLLSVWAARATLAFQLDAAAVALPTRTPSGHEPAPRRRGKFEFTWG